MTDASEPLGPPPPAELGPRGHYLLPQLMQVRGAVIPSDGSPVRIRLVLETGHELELPMTRGTATTLRSWLDALLEEKQLPK